MNFENMNLKNMDTLTVGVFPYQDYNKSVYCLKSAIARDQIVQCTNISGLLPYEYFVVFMLQVSE
jgi:hypothetical protein